MLTSDNLFLRVPEPADLDILYRWENDPSLWHVSDTLSPYSRHQIEQYLSDPNNDIFLRRQLRFMICQHSDNLPVGTIDLFDFQPIHQRIGIGIFIETGHRQLGYASEALKMALEYCHKSLRLKVVWCQIPQSNTPSIKLFQSIGFEHFGTAQNWIRGESGGWEDVWFYQKTLY